MSINARSNVTRCLANAFKELRKAQNRGMLEFWFIYLEGLLHGLGNVGFITIEQVLKIAKQRDGIYNAKEDEFEKEESRQRKLSAKA